MTDDDDANNCCGCYYEGRADGRAQEAARMALLIAIAVALVAGGWLLKAWWG